MNAFIAGRILSLGISSLMEIVKKSSIQDHWRTDETIATPPFLKK